MNWVCLFQRSVLLKCLVTAVKQRMKSVTNIQKITKAMKMVAASRLRIAQAATFESRGIIQPLVKLLGDLPGKCRFNAGQAADRAQVVFPELSAFGGLKRLFVASTSCSREHGIGKWQRNASGILQGMISLTNFAFLQLLMLRRIWQLLWRLTKACVEASTLKCQSWQEEHSKPSWEVITLVLDCLHKWRYAEQESLEICKTLLVKIVAFLSSGSTLKGFRFCFEVLLSQRIAWVRLSSLEKREERSCQEMSGIPLQLLWMTPRKRESPLPWYSILHENWLCKLRESSHIWDRNLSKRWCLNICKAVSNLA